MSKAPLLTHLCCAPDALYAVEVLQRDYDVTGYFFNPNIWPSEEYDLRWMETQKVEALLRFRLLEGPYDYKRWEKQTAAFAGAPEKGRRCDICYALRLDAAALKTAELGLPAFATVMSVSPWKKADVLNRIGRALGRKYGLRFVESDFKKKGGFQKSVELSRAQGLYRQDYCGCKPSWRPRGR
ncbi:MAG: epoxyqueuosine reductase QueH [Candidatus Aminicenantales bacterium]